MNKENRCQIGDVIQADEKWIYGHGNSSGEVFSVGHDHEQIVADYKGKLLPEYTRTDPTRATAKFVVIEAVFTGGGTGMGEHDIYPDGWQVTCQRLNEDGSYNPDGEKALFYQSGCFDCMIRQPNVVAKMKQTITFTYD